jgi:catechol 2,3-dioxygenase-like lactoylglutathione lyase family enzyme
MRLNSLIPELCVFDFQYSRNFYVDTLGFKILYERPEDNFAMLEYQGSQLMLDEISTTTRTWLSGPMEKPYGRGINLQIDSDEVDALYDRVKSSGAKIFLEMEEKWYRMNDIEGGNRQFIVMDPDGYLLRFTQDLGERPVP